MVKKIVYFDMDGVLCKFDKKFKKELDRNPSIKYPQATYGFFLNLEPNNFMVKLYEVLNKSKHFDVYILTAPSYLNPMCYTEKRVWVENNLGLEASSKMIISGYKNLLKGHYLIDDNNFGKGQEKFEGDLLLVDENNINKSVNDILFTLRKDLEKELCISSLY